jgi:hypothetical protein
MCTGTQGMSRRYCGGRNRARSSEIKTHPRTDPRHIAASPRCRRHRRWSRQPGQGRRGFASLDLAGGFDHSGPPSEESRAYIADALDAMLRGRRPA